MLGQNAIAFPVMLLFQALIFHIIMTAASPSRNKWSKSELEEIEQQWNGVHEDDDDISLDDQIYVESERRHKDATDKLQSFIDKGRYSPGDDEFEKLTREVEHAGKAAMLFAKLRMEDKLENDNGDEKKDINDEGKGGKLSWDALAKICSEWQVNRFSFAVSLIISRNIYCIALP